METPNASVDTAHLDALRLRLSHERSRLNSAKTPSEREMRAAWVASIEREVAGELKFLGLPPDQPLADIDVDALFAELTS